MVDVRCPLCWPSACICPRPPFDKERPALGPGTPAGWADNPLHRETEAPPSERGSSGQPASGWVDVATSRPHGIPGESEGWGSIGFKDAEPETVARVEAWLRDQFPYIDIDQTHHDNVWRAIAKVATLAAKGPTPR